MKRGSVGKKWFMVHQRTFFKVVASVVLEKWGKKGWPISSVSVWIPQNGDYFYTWIFSQAALERKWENSCF